MYVLENEGLLRIGVFIVLFALLSTLEVFFPRKALQSRRIQRWGLHSALLIGAVILSRITLPVAVTEFSYISYTKAWGLFNNLAIPFPLAFVISIVLLDLAIYIQHRLFHKWPLLWRFHQVHHSDKEMDVSTAIRFHPIEILLSAIYKFICIALLGAPVLAVLCFEILLNAGALFSHSNIRFSPKWDKRLRRLIVTPDMHRIHHSDLEKETNSNYGFFLSIWDRLFSTYTASPKLTYQNMVLGLKEYSSTNTLHFTWAFLLPFKKKPNNS